MRPAERSADRKASRSNSVQGFEIWLRRACGLVVASVAAYASYVHQRHFALHGGADSVSAALWPLSVDGLLLLATIGLLKPAHRVSRRTHATAWMAFSLGIFVSLAANMAAAPVLAWQPILVAGWPPIALLFAVELLTLHPTDRATDRGNPEHQCRFQHGKANSTTDQRDNAEAPRSGTPANDKDTRGRDPQPTASPPKGELTAEQIMWNYFQEQGGKGRTPTGAELDRVAGTNNYGRAVLKRWRENGRIASKRAQVHANGAELSAR
ncbi:DUF2637 domain-containing protein [Streptomyces sp. NPDC001530]|uniref:DUF2637 domain-containing protein n=1 Tax=Streptomyces sp. NPDC001530 TaxID=3364582 RepID=UPI00369D339F